MAPAAPPAAATENNPTKKKKEVKAVNEIEEISRAAKGKNNPTKKKKEEKAVDEIEEIFRAAKGKKKRKEPPRSSSTQAAASAEGKLNVADNKLKKESRKKRNVDGSSIKSEEAGSSRNRRKTADGLTIYSADELGIGNADAGGTPLCPFDCSCCF